MTRTCLSILALCLPATAMARPLSYEDAIARALDANPALRVAEKSLEQAEARFITSLGGFDPTLSLRGGYNTAQEIQFLPPFPDPFQTRRTSFNANASLSATAPTGTSATLESGIFNSNTFVETPDGDIEQRFFQPTFNFEVSQELLRGVRLAFNLQPINTARVQRSRAELEYEAARQDNLATVAQAYWNWVYLVDLVTIAELSLDVAKEQLRIGKARVDAGEAAPVEGTRLEAAKIQAETNLIQAANDAGDAADELLLLLGDNPGAPIEPASAPGEAPIIQLDLEAVTAVALEGNLDIGVARARVQEAEITLAVARHAMLPTLTANANAGLRGGSALGWSPAYDFLGQFPQFGISGVFSVPLGNRAAKGESRRANAELEAAQLQLGERERDVRGQVARQVRVIQAAATRISLADANARLAEQTLDAEEARYEAGRVLLQEVLDARRELDRTRVEAAKARTDFRVAEVELLRLQGRVED